MKIILTPLVSFSMLPREAVRSYKVRRDDYRFSLTLAWLFWQVTIAFWRFK
ncbi:MAG: hypothetical protein ACREDH_12155 [Methylocella sp.]